uniref:Uncharacterized protein n=1 Tax=Arundo donax TaxID=35708 RepID=A0A0A9Q509_ARUDO
MEVIVHQQFFYGAKSYNKISSVKENGDLHCSYCAKILSCHISQILSVSREETRKLYKPIPSALKGILICNAGWPPPC